jgi:hypothetical protein
VRKALIGAAAGVTCLVFAAVALATGTQQFFTFKFANPKVGKATTFTVDLHSTDPTNTAHNSAPDPARKVVIGLPKGTNLDQKATPQCTASANTLNANPSACSSKTIVATGTASANSTFATVGEINATVTGYNATGKKILLYIQPSPGAPASPFVISLQVSGSKSSGFKLTANPPPNCLPPGTPANGCASGEAPLDKLILTTKAKKSGKHVLVTTPATCPKSKKWTTTASITFKTDGTKAYKATTPCHT